MKKVLATTAVLAALAFAPAHAAELELPISMEAVEKALNDSNVKGKKAMDEFASDITSGLSKLLSIFELPK